MRPRNSFRRQKPRSLESLLAHRDWIRGAGLTDDLLLDHAERALDFIVGDVDRVGAARRRCPSGLRSTAPSVRLGRLQAAPRQPKCQIAALEVRIDAGIYGEEHPC